MTNDARGPRKRPFSLVSAAIALLLVLISLPDSAQGAALPQHDRVRILPGERLVPEAELVDHNGEAFNLARLKGRVSLVFFGFTHCPDVCPIGMQRMRMLEQSAKVPAAEIAYVLISVDGERDTPPILKDYLESYSPNFIGLTADPQVVKKIAKDYSVAFYKSAVDSEDGSYTISHSPQIFVVDQKGRARAEFYNPNVVAMASVVNAILNEGDAPDDTVSRQQE